MEVMESADRWVVSWWIGVKMERVGSKVAVLWAGSWLKKSRGATTQQRV
jgi:hypothetical protein